MPHENDIAEIAQIFLSATAQDCREYREAVRDVVQDNVPQAKVFLQENWAEGGHFVDQVCRQRVRACDAYIGLFGHRYGWKPPGYTKSITELEFCWAVERWAQRAAPIFILLPEKGSDADTQLHAWATALPRKGVPGRGDSRQQHQQAQQAFLAAVTAWASGGRILTFYGNRRQLEARRCRASRTGTWRCSARRWPGGASRLATFRRQSLDASAARNNSAPLSDALEAFRERAGQRAIALLVHGAENHGQREFAEFLYRWDDEWEDCSVYCGQPAEVDSIASLICWTCGELHEPVVGAASIDALAECSPRASPAARWSLSSVPPVATPTA
jgi:hypothetical protein